MRFFLLLALQSLFTISVVAHEDHHLEAAQLDALFGAIMNGISVQESAATSPAETDLCFNIQGHPPQCYPRSVFEDAVRRALPAAQQSLSEACPHCDPLETAELTQKAWANISIRLQTNALRLSGWAAEMAKIYGPSWVIYTAIFEAAEHAVAPFLPPGNPVCIMGQALYFCTAGTVKNTYASLVDKTLPTSIRGRLLSTPVRMMEAWKLRRRMDSLQATASVDVRKKAYHEELAAEAHSDPYEEFLSDTHFWQASYLHFRGNQSPVADGRDGRSVTLHDDLEFIFSNESPSQRFARAAQHGNGFSLLRQLLTSYVTTRLQDRAGTVPTHSLSRQFRAEKRMLGLIGALIERYRSDLITVALSPLTSEQKIQLKVPMQWLLGELLESLKRSHEILRSGADTAMLIDHLEDVLYLEKGFRKGRLTQMKLTPRDCAGPVLVAGAPPL
jgi:hypothetical protein